MAAEKLPERVVDDAFVQGGSNEGGECAACDAVAGGVEQFEHVAGVGGIGAAGLAGGGKRDVAHFERAGFGSVFGVVVADADGFAEHGGAFGQQVFVGEDDGAARQAVSGEVEADVGADAGGFAGGYGDDGKGHGVSVAWFFFWRDEAV